MKNKNKNKNKKIGFILGATLALSTVANAGEIFKLESASLKGSFGFSEKYVLNGFGCSGENISPSLEWSNVPEGTKSFAVTFYDKDAPTESGFWHWTVYDIPVGTTSLVEGAGNNKGKLPKGAKEAKNDTGNVGYIGACPPIPRTHDYQFKVHSLSVETLPVKAEMTPALISFYINNNKLGEAKLTITHRQKVGK